VKKAGAKVLTLDQVEGLKVRLTTPLHPCLAVGSGLPWKTHKQVESRVASLPCSHTSGAVSPARAGQRSNDAGLHMGSMETSEKWRRGKMSAEIGLGLGQAF